MEKEERDTGFIKRYGWAIGLASSIAAIVLLVFVYKATAPRSIQDTTASGDKSEVLQVGALPVT